MEVGRGKNLCGGEKIDREEKKTRALALSSGKKEGEDLQWV